MVFLLCTAYIHVMSLKEESGRFFFHFREVFEKCIEYIGKFLIHFREIFVKKWFILEEICPFLWFISWSLPDDEGGITCMSLSKFTKQQDISLLRILL